MHRSSAIALLGLLALSAWPARAELVASSHHDFPLAFYASPQWIPLRPDGGSTLTVEVAEAGLYAFSLSAGCSAAALSADAPGGVALDLLVNGRLVPSSRGSAAPFCSVNTRGAFRSAMASMLLTAPLQAGSNDIRLRARLLGDALGAEIGWPRLIVWR